MIRCSFVALFVICVAIPTSALAATAPIRTQAELQRYLRETPIQNTPLAPLPPSSRKRFLEQVQFRAYGVDIEYGEPAAELTHPQIAQLYALFGQSAPAGIGLTAAQQQRRMLERNREARRRHCVPAQCPESEVERHFGEFAAIEPRFDLPDAQRFAAGKRDYDRLFGDFFLTPAALRAVGDPDLRLLIRALHITLYAVPDDAHLAQLRRVLQEMQHRGMTEDADFKELHDAEVAARQFAAARALRAAHPALRVAALPALVSSPAPAAGLPTVLSVDARADTMQRQAVDLGGPLRIVVIAGCHFSENAAKAIQGDAMLRPLFARHSLWLAAPSQPIADVAAWNNEFADLPMHVAWRLDEWSMLPSWSMPTYYVFRDGRLVKQFSGWLGTAKLKQSLREAGAL